jgi:hypothetical protein
MMICESRLSLCHCEESFPFGKDDVAISSGNKRSLDRTDIARLLTH